MRAETSGTADLKIDRDSRCRIRITCPIIAGAANQCIIAQTARQGIVQAVAYDPIGAIAATEVLALTPAGTQRIIACIPVERLARANATHQAISIIATKKGLSCAQTSDNRVISRAAINVLIFAIRADQAIRIVAAKEVLVISTARDQRVIASVAVDILA